MAITLEKDLAVRTFETPPRGFDLLKASPADLKRFGLPAIPEDARQKARYQQVVRQLGERLNFITPTMRRNVDRFHGPRKRLPSAGTETSPNWSGGIVFAPAGKAFQWVEADWVVPNVDAPTENMWYYSSNWIGIDGDGSNDVCQIGFECEAFRSGSSVTTQIYPWWEWYPESEVQITNFAVQPGDMVTALICTSGAGATSATAYLTNRTTGLSINFSFSAPAGTQLVGNCAEWIVEAPTVGGAQSTIADYGEVFFSSCDCWDGDTVDGGTGDNINLDAGGTTLSQGTLITPTIIQCQYAGTLP
jgi:Peptidase A4 family